MTRYRLVSQQNEGRLQISSVIIGEDEIHEQLAAEALLHLMSGWEVHLEEHVVRCRKGDIERTITVRSSEWANDSI